MNRSSKDADEIMKFMALFQRLKEWTDDAPNDLASLAMKDASIRELCDEVWVAAFEIQSNERRCRELFIAPADPKFIEAWRDYEERYEPLIPTFLDKILEDVLAGTDRPSINSTAPIGKKQPTAHREWKIADDDAQEQAKGIDGAIDWARCEVENGIVDDEDFLAQLDEGVSAWDRLVQDHGLDLRGIFRRRALIPFVLVPRQVSAKHGSAEKLSLLTNLQQAHDAFVFGAPYAALAMMRSIMEAVLRDHYMADGKDLNERIKHVQKLPPGANKAALDRLRKRANAVLHLDGTKAETLTDLDKTDLEKEIVSLLLVLRNLIEGAPR